MRFLLRFGVIGVIVFFLAVILFNVLIGGLATQYAVQFWASYIKGVQVSIPFLPCAVAGLFLGEVAVPVAYRDMGTFFCTLVPNLEFVSFA